MDIQQYISSGILEAYVLGALSESERAGVETLMVRYPEIATEVEAIEAAMLRLDESAAMTPPPAAKEQAWQVLQHSARADAVVPEPVQKTPAKPEPKVIQITWLRMALWAALITSVIANFVLMSQRNEHKSGLQSRDHKIDSLQLVLRSTLQEKALMANPAVHMLQLRAREAGTPMAAIAYVQAQQQKMYVSVAALPALPSGQQYRLWVMQGPEMKPLGTLNAAALSGRQLQEFKLPAGTISGFAVSRQPEGSTAAPAPDGIYLLGRF